MGMRRRGWKASAAAHPAAYRLTPPPPGTWGDTRARATQGAGSCPGRGASLPPVPPPRGAREGRQKRARSGASDDRKWATVIAAPALSALAAGAAMGRSAVGRQPAQLEAGEDLRLGRLGGPTPLVGLGRRRGLRLRGTLPGPGRVFCP